MDLCKYADRCEIYQRCVNRNEEDAVLQIDEVCSFAVRYQQKCYKDMEKKGGSE